MRGDPLDRTGIVAALLSVFVWQLGLIVQKFLVEGSNTGSLMLIQVGSAAALMWMVLLARGKQPKFASRTLLNIAWGLLAPGLVFGLGIMGAARTDGVSVALIWGLLPLLGPFLARVILREPLHWTFPAGALIGFGGLALTLLGREPSQPIDLVGNLLVLSSVFCAGFSSVIARVVNRIPRMWFQAATLQLTGATLCAGGFIWLTGWSAPDLSRGANLAAMAYLIFIMTVFNYAAFNFALSRVPVAWVGMTGALAPVCGMALAVALLGTPLRLSDMASAAVIVSGVALPHLYRITVLRRTARAQIMS